MAQTVGRWIHGSKSKKQNHGWEREKQNDGQIRRLLKQRISRLAPESLLTVEHFLAYLEERECQEATEELLQIPGLSEAIDKAKKEIAQGKMIPWENPSESIEMDRVHLSRSAQEFYENATAK